MIQKFSTRTFVWVQSRFVQRPRLTLVLLGVFIALPGFLAIGSMIGERWYPTGDVSHTELMLRAIPNHFPLIGVAARVGNDLNNQGSTPGASMAYVMYPNCYKSLGEYNSDSRNAHKSIHPSPSSYTYSPMDLLNPKYSP